MARREGSLPARMQEPAAQVISSGQVSFASLTRKGYKIYYPEDVVWGPVDGLGDTSDCFELSAMSDSHLPTAEGLMPLLISAPISGELEAEYADGRVLAQALPSLEESSSDTEFIWIRPETTLPLLAGMLKRQAAGTTTPNVEFALDHHLSLRVSIVKALKLSATGRRLAVYWPIDDTWCDSPRQGSLNNNMPLQLPATDDMHVSSGTAEQSAGTTRRQALTASSTMTVLWRRLDFKKNLRSRPPPGRTRLVARASSRY